MEFKNIDASIQRRFLAVRSMADSRTISRHGFRRIRRRDGVYIHWAQHHDRHLVLRKSARNNIDRMRGEKLRGRHLASIATNVLGTARVVVLTTG